MAPIRKGDGTPLEIPGVQEVRSGDGRVFFEGGAIPDSGRNQYLVEDFSTSNWPDSIGSSDIDTVSGLTFDSSAFNDSGGVFSDGIDDFGTSDTMGNFGSNTDQPHAISIPFETTDSDSTFLGVENNSSDYRYMVSIGHPFVDSVAGSNSPTIVHRDASGDQYSVEANSTWNDGNAHHVIFNITGNSGSDVEIYVDDMTDDIASVGQNATLTNVENFEHDMAYFTSNVEGSPETDGNRNIEAGLGDVRWFSDSLDESGRQSVHDSLDWT